ncbi:MAG: class II aldolase/adducin family protein [Clostridiales bacterium]|nr:class II aldolase/adducin family protein [Candidatus Crickella merdequi]
MDFINEQEARELLVQHGNKLLSSGLVQGTWGNLSIRINSEYMICTPSGLDYTRLGPEDMVKVNLYTLEYDEEHENKPTSEKGFHSQIYLTHPDAGAVVHAHSLYSCIYAACSKDMNIKNVVTAGIIGKKIPCADYGMAGTEKLTKNIIAALRKSGAKGCFMDHHGMVCYGKDMKDAFRNALTIEESAKKHIEAKWNKLNK